MNDSLPTSSGRTYWQSFEHLANSPEVAAELDKEFSKYDPEAMRSLPRRSFLKYAAASMALAGVGLAGCRRWPKEVIAPYAHKPTDRVPGVPEYFATSWELGGVGSGLLVASFDGRPIKVEGNPSHPGNVTRSGEWASADVFAQAQPLSLYDPERSRAILERRAEAARTQSPQWFDETLVPRLQEAEGAGMAILCEATSSPTVARLKAELEAAKPGATWYTWEALAPTGGEARPVYSLDKAAVVVSLDDDYLGSHPAHTRYAADWSTMRATADGDHDGHAPRMSKCYTAECRHSITGASSDVRLPIRPSRLLALAEGLAAALGVGGVEEPTLEAGEIEFVEAAAADLQANAGGSLVAFGPHVPNAVKAVAVQINEQLGNVGETIRFIEDPTVRGETINALVERLNAGEVEHLLILGGNPAYDAPADLNFGEAMRNADLSVHLSSYLDETSLLATVHVPRAHFLECWGDTRGWDGTIAPTQPLIMPLFNGVSPIEMLAKILGVEKTDGLSLVRETFAGLGVEGDKAWRKVLHDGVLADSAAEATDAPSYEAGEVPASSEGYELAFAGDASVYDGRFANNGWLQEVPEPMSKLCWDNAALMSAHDADHDGVNTGDVVTITVGGRALDVAVYVMPGQPDGVIGLALGYGRRAGGNLAVVGEDNGGGFDTYRLRTTNALAYASGATVAKRGQRYLLAMTQNHHLIDDVGFKGREKRTGYKGEPGYIIRESTFDEHADYLAHAHNGHAKGGHNKHPANAPDHAVTLQIFSPPSEFNDPHAWGMTIDMNTCIGCSACVVACQSENNIPVVGKESVLNNREMHWLRIDRYFKSGGEDTAAKKRDPKPDTVFQPMMCVHCENAPCEQVCPVAATVHDTEGLNTMVYNRCIGTRYCSNNCPYKVRRFNYLDYHYKGPKGSTLDATFVGIPDQQQTAGIDAIKRMVFNPDVTVRMRGVMEKCTYCTQRIQVKTIWRRNKGEQVQDGDIKTACQTACPTEAIVFGNLNDGDARVTKGQKQARAYDVLGELNTRPRTKYLAKLRNRPQLAAPEPGDTSGSH